MTTVPEVETSPTVLVSRSPNPSAATKASEEETIHAILAAAPGSTVVVPHLYHLADDHPLWERLRVNQGALVVLSVMYARAVRWVLTARGVCDAEAQDTGRPLTCIRWDPEAGPAAMAQAVAAAAGPRPALQENVLRLDHAVPRPRWYPVIDYERCSRCGQCHEFCVFGVYEKDDGAVQVKRPDNCKPGCPACARMCPRGSIMFPDCDEPLIAGADAAPESGAPSPQPRPAEAEAARTDDELDDLIAALDDLDV